MKKECRNEFRKKLKKYCEKITKTFFLIIKKKNQKHIVKN